MKKALALILAAMMVAGTSAVAFAAEPDVKMSQEVFKWNSDNGCYEEIVNNATVSYGSKLAFPLWDSNSSAGYISDSDDIRNLKAYPEYKVGESLVAEKPTIEYRKVSKDGVAKYIYVIELELKDSTSTATKDFFGEMYVGRTSSSAKEKTYTEFNLTVANTKAPEEDAGSDYFEVAGEENYVIDFDDCDICDIEFTSKSGNSYALFTVDASGQGKENVGFSVKFNSEIAAKYPEANLEFLSFTANPVFNRTGELYIYADEDTFIYEVTADGLKEIKNAEYDESSEAWVIKTRYLKSYAVSDVELDLTADKDEASSSETSSSNPVTGGTTGTTEGNTNVKPNPNTGR